jgi:hypothetical protein
MKFKRGMIVEMYNVTDTSDQWGISETYPFLIGEVIEIERHRVLILFRSIGQCAWFDKDMDIRPASKAVKVLYGQS